MAQQLISKIKQKRGTREQRKTTKIEEGELVYETDTYRLFIGIGDNDTASLPAETIGGVIVGNYSFKGPVDSDPLLETEAKAWNGDLMYANNLLWRLNDTTWEKVSTVVDDQTIYYDANNKLKIKSTAFSAGNGININDYTISVAVKANTPLQFDNNQLTIGTNSITGDLIKSTAFFNKHFKLIGSQWELNVNNNVFDSTGTSLSVKQIPSGEKTDTVSISNDIKYGSFNALLNDRISNGEPNKSGLAINETNDVSISDTISVKDSLKQIIGVQPGVFNLLSGNTVNKDHNGTIDESNNNWKGATRESITVYNTSVESEMIPINGINISSAGFITFKSGGSSNDKRYKSFAIPIYELPGNPEVYNFVNTVSNKYLQGSNLGASKLYMLSGPNNSKEYYPISNILYDTNKNLYKVTWSQDLQIVSPGLFLETPSGETVINTSVNSGINSVKYEVINTGDINEYGLTICGINLYNNSDLSLTTIQYSLASEPNVFKNLTIFSATIPTTSSDVIVNYGELICRLQTEDTGNEAVAIDQIKLIYSGGEPIYYNGSEIII